MGQAAARRKSLRWQMAEPGSQGHHLSQIASPLENPARGSAGQRRLTYLAGRLQAAHIAEVLEALAHHGALKANQHAQREE